MLVTRKQAAEYLGVHPKTVATWERRGHLTRLSDSLPHKPVYRLVDVVEAERTAREAAIRTSGVDTLVKRTRDTLGMSNRA